MKKVLYIALSLAVVFSLIGCASTDKAISTVTVSANAELKLEPDVAKFTVSAEAIEDTSEEARAKTSVMVNQAIDILTTLFGVEKSDIVTDYINISPNYIWQDNQRVLDGQRASQSIEVTLRNIEVYGDIFTALSKIDGISVSTASLDKLDKTSEINEVRRLAVEAAFDKATAYAEAAGMKIKGVISINGGSSSPSYSYPNVMLAKTVAYEESSSSTEYYAGDITISDSVSIVYELGM